MGHLTGANRIQRPRVEDALLQAALDAGEEPQKSKSTIKSSLDYGEQDPMYPKEVETLVEYVYHDANGDPLFKVLKTPDKKFSQRAYKNGSWDNYDLKDVERVLYRLPRVLEGLAKGEIIWVVEGERDVHSLESLGLYATTNAHGAGKWRESYSKVLAGASVVILPDHDIPGLEHAVGVLESLLGHGCDVSVVLPEEGMDATDVIEAGKKIEDLPKVDKAALELRISALRTRLAGGIISAADLLSKKFPETQWAVDGLIGEGVTLLFSAPKLRKSFLSLDIAASIACGRKVLDRDVNQGAVLYLALEDSERRVGWRLSRILGGQPPGPLYIYPLTSGPWPALDEGGDERIIDWCKSEKNARLVIVDVFEKVRGAAKGDSIYRADYEAIRPLSYVFGETGVPVLAVHHTNKGTHEDPFAAVSGSNGLRGAVDNLMYLKGVGTDGALLMLQGRDVEAIEIPLIWNQGERGNEVLRWEVSDIDPKFLPIVELLNEFTKLNVGEIAAHLEVSMAEAQALLAKAVISDVISTQQDGRNAIYFLPAS
jgi:5S rRNA maturation endonuclease (ribonuclease M5)